METLHNEYTLFLSDIKLKIRQAQYEAMRSVNTRLVFSIIYALSKLLKKGVSSLQKGLQ